MCERPLVALIGAAVLLSLLLVGCRDQIPMERASERVTASTGGICDRSTEIREALVGAMDEVGHCAEVTDEHLASLDGGLDLSGLSLDAIRPGDLAGLSRLQSINLSGNRLRQLPAELFSGLAGLCRINLEGNPGAPFAFILRLRNTRLDDLNNVVVEADRIPPFAVNVLLRNDHVALSTAIVRIPAGQTWSAAAQLGGVFGAEQGSVWIADAAFAPGAGCEERFAHRGLTVAVDHGEVAANAADAHGAGETTQAEQSPCAGIPTQEIVVNSRTFERDERIVRFVSNGSGRCYAGIAIEPDPGRTLGGECRLTEFVQPLSRGTSQSGAAEGDCDWLRIERLSGQGGPPPGVEGCAAPALTLRADAETFNRRGRVDVVRFDLAERCYSFLSVAQDPNRAEPHRFSPGQSCLLRSGQPRGGDCGSIVSWSGVGRGGVDSESDARAEVARIRPAQPEEADADRVALIDSCLRLTPLRIEVDADALGRGRALHAVGADSQGQCYMALIVAIDHTLDPPRAAPRSRRCAISAEFQLLGFPHFLPTTRTGNCEGLFHIAWFSPAGGRTTAAEFANLVEIVADEIAGSDIGAWAPDGIEWLCVNDVCMLGWAGSDSDAEPH